MNNKITEYYCSFKVSILLKEKGFGVPTSRYYNTKGEVVVNFEDSGSNESEYYFDADSFNENWNDGRVIDKNNVSCWGCGNNKNYFPPISIPTHSIVIKWLMENFDINIWVYPRLGHYSPSIMKNNSIKHTQHWDFYNTIEDATEAALLFTLTNLIP